MRVKITRKLICFLLLGLVGYYVIFQAFYNIVAFKSIFPYDGFLDMLGGVAYNFTPTFIQALFITAVVFRPTKEQPIGQKIAVDAILVTAINILVNLSFLHFITVPLKTERVL